jgi:hypothetical protein
MRNSLITICAALLMGGLAACNRGGGNGSDEDRLNKAAHALDNNGVYDTSADDAALNQAELSVDEGGPGNAASNAATNAAAPGNSAATGNRR